MGVSCHLLWGLRAQKGVWDRPSESLLPSRVLRALTTRPDLASQCSEPHLSFFHSSSSWPWGRGPEVGLAPSPAPPSRLGGRECGWPSPGGRWGAGWASLCHHLQIPKPGCCWHSWLRSRKPRVTGVEQLGQGHRSRDVGRLETTQACLTGELCPYPQQRVALARVDGRVNE